MSETTIEAPVAIYRAENAPIVTDTIYRIDSHGGRYYYKLNNGEPEFGESVTTILGRTMPKAPQLVEWIANMGYAESMQFMNERACYGTTMHVLAGEYLQGIPLDLDGDHIPLSLMSQAEIENVGYNHAWPDEMKRDLLAFAQWVKDYKVTPIVIEQVLLFDRVGGALDLVCDLTLDVPGFYGEVWKSGPRKGEPKETKQEQRVRAIVDFKSGRKGFWESHEIQLYAYRDLWNSTFPEDPVQLLFNWSPKEWRTAPSYNFKDQSVCESHIKWQYLKSLAFCQGPPRPRDIVSCEGVLEPGGDLAKNVRRIDIVEFIKERHQ